jgi:hypothetical protein
MHVSAGYFELKTVLDEGYKEMYFFLGSCIIYQISHHMAAIQLSLDSVLPRMLQCQMIGIPLCLWLAQKTLEFITSNSPFIP